MRGHRFKLFKEHSGANARKSFFTQRVVNVWNSFHQRLLILVHSVHQKGLLNLRLVFIFYTFLLFLSSCRY